MATFTPPNTNILTLDLPDTNKLLIEPTLAYGNPMAGVIDGGLFHVEMGKDKMQMTHLQKPRFNLQPKSDCKTWNPTVRYGLRSDEIVVTDYEVNGEQCNDEFDRACARNLQGSQDDKLFMDRNPGLQPLQGAMILTLQESIKDDTFRNVWFSDKSFGTGSYMYDSVLDLGNAEMDPEERARLTTMVSQQDGIWAEIKAYVDDNKIRYVDSNNGVAANNALDPANIADYLRTLKKNSSPKLRMWGRGVGSNVTTRPYFLLQSGLYEALLEYYRSLGTEASHQFILNGEAVPGVYMFDGHLVLEVPEWTMWDSEIGMMSPVHGDSMVQRAIFTVPGNITLLANAKQLPGFENQGLIIQQSTQVRDKGVMWMYYNIGFGMSIAHNDLITVGYNSSLTTWNFSATYNNAFASGAPVR